MKRPSFPTRSEDLADVCGISNPFGLLSPAEGQITHVLLTRPPLYYGPKPHSRCDLHVLGLPLTFALSQDQTLQLNLESLFTRFHRLLSPRNSQFLTACDPRTECSSPHSRVERS